MPRVLYIEDNKDNRLLVRRILMASDFDVVVDEAESAQIGIDLALKQPPDLILMDLSMPDMDGLTATKRIRNLPTLRDIPIVALTANAMESDKDRSIEAGCDGYIKKPIDVDKFPEEVIHYIRSRNERRSKHQPAADANRVEHESAANGGGADLQPAADAGGIKHQPTTDASGIKHQPAADANGAFHPAADAD